MSEHPRHAEFMAKQHEEDILDIFEILNEMGDELHELKTKLAKLTGEPAPSPRPKRPTPEEIAAEKAAAEKAAKKAALLEQMRLLEAEGK